jgi:hypothetical protein
MMIQSNGSTSSTKYRTRVLAYTNKNSFFFSLFKPERQDGIGQLRSLYHPRSAKSIVQDRSTMFMLRVLTNNQHLRARLAGSHLHCLSADLYRRSKSWSVSPILILIDEIYSGVTISTHIVRLLGGRAKTSTRSG